ncbi:MAG: type II toxin-antitoxin system RelE/ParE family toxin, partial [Deltaproteobacteria bacterium]
MAWRVELSEDAERDFATLDGSLRKLVRNKLAKLEANPNIGEELHNRAGCDLRGYYKLYFNGTRYRIVYRIENDILLVLIIGIGQRAHGAVYRMVAGRVNETEN